jgi:hypothetical protein
MENTADSEIINLHVDMEGSVILNFNSENFRLRLTESIGNIRRLTLENNDISEILFNALFRKVPLQGIIEYNDGQRCAVDLKQAERQENTIMLECALRSREKSD